MLLGTARPEAPSDTTRDTTATQEAGWLPPAGAADRDPRPPRPVPRAPPRLKPARSNGRAPSRRLPGAFPPWRERGSALGPRLRGRSQCFRSLGVKRPLLSFYLAPAL